MQEEKLEVLKRIHSIERESASDKWETSRWNKYERYIEALADYEVNFLDLKPVLTFVENHKDLLKIVQSHFYTMTSIQQIL